MAPDQPTPSSSSSASASTSKKRKPAPRPAAPVDDDRFAALSSFKEPTTGTFPKQSTSTSLPAHLLPSSHTSNKNRKEPGLIYLSRIPPGMGPAKVKHLLEAYGEVGRVFLKRAETAQEPISKNPKKRQHEKHKEHKFEEGWVEFEDKRVARSVAEMLNAENIGGKKGTRWRDDVWTMKYLPRFRWDMLSEQVALERATQTSLLRFHLQHSRTEQESYLSAVEQARVARKIEEKREGKRKAVDGDGVEEGGEPKKKGRTYRQREVLDPSALKAEEGGEGKRKGTKKQLDEVLGRLF